MKLEGQSQDCPFCVLSGRICKSRMGRKDGNQMSESYTENEEVFADIVISGRIFGSDGRARNGALAVKDGKYLAIGDCDEISRYIGLYSQATGDNVHEMGAAYQPSGEYKIMSDNLTMKVGDQANLTVYDEKVDVYSELEQSESKVLMKIENGEIIYRRRNPGNRTCAGMHFHP